MSLETEYQKLAHRNQDQIHTIFTHSNGVFSLMQDSLDYKYTNLCKILGFSHDIGKISKAFQSKINIGYESDGVSHPPKGVVDHATWSIPFLKLVFKQIAKDETNKSYLILLQNIERMFSYLTAGHHGGLRDFINDKERNHSTKIGDKNFSSLSAICKEVDWENVDIVDFIGIDKSKLKEEILSIFPEFNKSKLLEIKVKAFLLAELLFSNLICSDCLDTERFYNPKSYSGHFSNRASIQDLKRLTDIKTEDFKFKSIFTNIDRMRLDMAKDVENAINNTNSNFYTITAPTGGGKTFLALKLATSIAVKQNKRRIIYVAPFIAIIEQTARVFADVLGRQNVLEDHSRVEIDDISETEDSKEQAEYSKYYRKSNQYWDSPFVLTTMVKFFEMLFSSNKSRLRRIQALYNSVIIIDEVQNIPKDYLMPLMFIMRILRDLFNCTFIFMTATHMDLMYKTNEYNEWIKENVGYNDFFMALKETFAQKYEYSTFNEKINLACGDAIEVIKNRDYYFKEFNKRVIVTYLNKAECPTNETLADMIIKDKQVLTIVNTRSHAQDLYKIVKSKTDKPVFCLTTLDNYNGLITRKFNEIKRLLKEGKDVIVISTQIIEAGVDITFPVLYRSEASIISEMQAGGRCNRNSELGEYGGKVFIFHIAENKYYFPFIREIQETRLAIHKTGNGMGLDTCNEFFKSDYKNSNINRDNLLGKLLDRPANNPNGIDSKYFDYNFEDLNKKLEVINLGRYGYTSITILNDETRATIEKMKKHTEEMPYYKLFNREDFQAIYNNTINVNIKKEDLKGYSIYCGKKFFVLNDNSRLNEEVGFVLKSSEGKNGEMV